SVNIRCTRFGTFNLSPLPGEQIIPRNFGRAPGSLSVNVRVSRTFGFGGEAKRSTSSQQQKSQGGTGDVAAAKRAGGGPTMIGGSMGGGSGPRGGGGGEGPRGGGPQMMTMGGPGGAGSAGKYQLTLSVNFQNLLNHVNLGPPVGNLSSPL